MLDKPFICLVSLVPNVEPSELESKLGIWRGGGWMVRSRVNQKDLNLQAERICNFLIQSWVICPPDHLVLLVIEGRWQWTTYLFAIEVWFLGDSDFRSNIYPRESEGQSRERDLLKRNGTQCAWWFELPGLSITTCTLRLGLPFLPPPPFIQSHWN